MRTATFRSLVADTGGDTVTVIARFLALLELFREGAVAFDQVAALGELHVRWTGADDGGVEVDDEFDEPEVYGEDVSVLDEVGADEGEPAGLGPGIGAAETAGPVRRPP